LHLPNSYTTFVAIVLYIYKMQNIVEFVDLLEKKFHLFIEKYDFLVEENTVLRDNLAKLQHEMHEKEQLLEENLSELRSLRIAKTIQGSNNTKETTQKINTLIKEVDLCIAQLSD